MQVIYGEGYVLGVILMARTGDTHDTQGYYQSEGTPDLVEHPDLSILGGFRNAMSVVMEQHALSLVIRKGS